MENKLDFNSRVLNLFFLILFFFEFVALVFQATAPGRSELSEEVQLKMKEMSEQQLLSDVSTLITREEWSNFKDIVKFSGHPQEIKLEIEAARDLLKNYAGDNLKLDESQKMVVILQDLKEFYEIRNQKNMVLLVEENLQKIQNWNLISRSLETREIRDSLENLKSLAEKMPVENEVRKATLVNLTKIYQSLNLINKGNVDMRAFKTRAENLQRLSTKDLQEIKAKLKSIENNQSNQRNLSLALVLFPLFLTLALFVVKNKQMTHLKEVRSTEEVPQWSLEVPAESGPFMSSDVASQVLSGIPDPFIILDEEKRVVWMNLSFRQNFGLDNDILSSPHLTFDVINSFTDFSDPQAFAHLNENRDVYSTNIKVQQGPKAKAQHFRMSITELNVRLKKLYYVFYTPFKDMSEINFYEAADDHIPMVMMPVVLNEKEQVLSLSEIIDKTITHFSRKIQNLGILVDCIFDEDLYVSKEMKNSAEIIVRLFEACLMALSQIEDSSLRKLKLDCKNKNSKNLLRFTFSAGETRFFEQRLKRMAPLLEQIGLKHNIVIIRKSNQLFHIELDILITPIVEKKVPFSTHKLELS